MNKNMMISSRCESTTSSRFSLLALFCFGVTVTALGQPDRGISYCFLSYLCGFVSIFTLLFLLKTKIMRFLVSISWMLAVQLFQLNWLATTTYHGKGILAVYVLLALGIALQFGLLSLFVSSSQRFSVLRGAAIASLWTLMEISRLYYLCGFPFNAVGLVMCFHPIMLQMASLFGMYGLTFWVMFAACLGARAFYEKSLKRGALWMIVLLLPPFFGYSHIWYHDQKSPKAKQIDVALIQTGLAVEEKWQFPKSSERYLEPFMQWKKIFEMVEATGKKSFDLIVMPEVALPGDAFHANIDFEKVLKEILKEDDRLPALCAPMAEVDALGRWQVGHIWLSQAIANRFKSEMIIGLLDYDASLEESYNSAFHFVPFRSFVERYEKRVLVPLAEYLPLPMMKSFLEEFGINSFFTPGTKAKVFHGQVPLSVSICYEEGYNHLIREGKVLGAGLFVNVSNDGWFPQSRLPVEHFNLGRLRSIENGVPLVRSCNTGITAVVDSLGRIEAQLPEWNAWGGQFQGVLATSLSLYSYTTLYSMVGNYLLIAMCLVILLLFFFYNKSCRL